VIPANPLQRYIYTRANVHIDKISDFVINKKVMAIPLNSNHKKRSMIVQITLHVICYLILKMHLVGITHLQLLIMIIHAKAE
jgi:hypothetical protein